MKKTKYGTLYSMQEAIGFSKPKLGLLLKIQKASKTLQAIELFSDDLREINENPADQFYLPIPLIDTTIVPYTTYFLGPNEEEIELVELTSTKSHYSPKESFFKQ